MHDGLESKPSLFSSNPGFSIQRYKQIRTNLNNVHPNSLAFLYQLRTQIRSVSDVCELHNSRAHGNPKKINKCSNQRSK